MHRWQTPSSGGWANAISICPETGPCGEIYLCLTDSEWGYVWALEWTREGSFEIIGSLNLNEVTNDCYTPEQRRGPKEDIGASVAVWYNTWDH